MNIILLLSAFKKSWVMVKKVLSFLLEYWYLVIIALMLIINSSLRNDIVDLNKEKDTLNQNMVALVQKNKTDLLEAQKKAQEKEIEILTKQKEVEVKYNEQIKNLQSDVVTATDANRRLSDTLRTNADKLSKLTAEQNRAYTTTLSKLFEDSTTKYRAVSEKADEHRLAEERCVSLYNSLVDDNKR